MECAKNPWKWVFNLHLFQFYLVMKGQGKELEEPTPVMKSQISKFNKRKGNFQQSSNGSSQGLDQLHMSEKDINVSSQVPTP